MLRRFLILCAAGVIAGPAHAEWISVGGPDSGAVWYMDGNRITVENGRVHAWVKVDASHDSTVKYREKMALYSVICSSRQIKTISMTDYDSYGKVIYSNSNADSAYGTYGYDEAIPETMGETVVNIACAVTKGK